MSETTTTTPSPVDLATVASVYDGRAGKCACGCAGKHYYSASAPNLTSYNTVNDSHVARVVRFINAHLDRAVVDTEYRHIVYVEFAGRIYVARMKDAQEEI